MGENNLKNFFNIENRTKYFVHLLIFLSVFSFVIFILLLLNNKSVNKKENIVVKNKTDLFKDIILEGKSAIVWDVINKRELFSKNPDLPLPLASLTKVMTAITMSENLPNSSNIEITAEFLEPEGDSKLKIGDSWQTDDLRDFTLLTSSNDGAFALASISQNKNIEKKNNHFQFIKSMNDLASKIGLTNSRFFNEHGLDRQVDRGGAYGSAKDMALLFEYTLKNEPQILEATRYKNLKFTTKEQTYEAENTNSVLDKIPGLMASKTGYTDLAGGNLIIAYDAGLNRPIIISVLGSTAEGRFIDTLKLVEASLKYIQQN